MICWTASGTITLPRVATTARATVTGRPRVNSGDRATPRRRVAHADSVDRCRAGAVGAGVEASAGAWAGEVRVRVGALIGQPPGRRIGTRRQRAVGQPARRR